MIPPVISPYVKSNAERKVFAWFKSAPGTESWVVLHSLGIATHGTKIYSEIDFLVLAPGKGMFAIEVKGGRVSRREGLWYFTDRYGNESFRRRGPFEQALEAAYSVAAVVKAKLSKEFSYLHDLLFGAGVIFPDIEYHNDGIDHELWQIHDLRDGNDVVRFISRLSRKTAEKIKDKLGREIPFKSYLGIKEVNYIASLLRGDFDRPIPLKTHIRTAEEQRIILTEEQYRLVDQLEDNPRCLIQGGAGTGKTLLAIQEVAKSVVSRNRTALICFNQNLGQWLHTHFDDPSIKPDFVGTFHSFLLGLLPEHDQKIPMDEAGRRIYFGKTLPEKILRLLDDTFNRYDLLVIDEAQDLVNDLYLDIFDLILKGGLSRGRWRMFGDFSMQAIFSQPMEEKEMINFLDKRTSFINFKLTVNCRNPKPVSDEIETVTGYSPKHSGALKIEGPPVNYYIYEDDVDGARLVETELENLLEEGVEPAQITLLSRMKFASSLASLISEFDIEEYSPYGNTKISFSTIQGFKGLENQIIMILDIDSFHDRRLLYVAYSRTATALYVFTRLSAKQEYYDLQRRRLMQ